MPAFTTSAQVVDSITYAHDGPVTAFVLISRAAEIASQGADSEVVANALHEALVAHGFLASEEESGAAINSADGDWS